MNTSQNDLIATQAVAAPSIQLPPGVGLAEQINASMDDPAFRQRWPEGYPDICDEEGEMGEATLHTLTCDILVFGLESHFADRVEYRVFRNLNLDDSRRRPDRFVAPDAMVVETSTPLPVHLSSYRLGQDGPVPRLMAEVLSPRNFKEMDLKEKPKLYRALGVEEYILIDVSGELMPRRLLLMRRQANGSWKEEQDADGGVTSQLGFRLVIDADGQLRVLDARTGKPYPRLSELRLTMEHLTAETEARRQAAEREAAARRQAEERVKALEEELARLRVRGPQPNDPGPQT